jgi:hypothetical protein
MRKAATRALHQTIFCFVKIEDNAVTVAGQPLNSFTEGVEDFREWLASGDQFKDMPLVTQSA